MPTPHGCDLQHPSGLVAVVIAAGGTTSWPATVLHVLLAQAAGVLFMLDQYDACRNGYVLWFEQAISICQQTAPDGSHSLPTVFFFLGLLHKGPYHIYYALQCNLHAMSDSLSD